MLGSIQPITQELPWRSPAALIVNGIGDHLLALPALRALSTLMQGRLRLLCLPTARDLFFSDVPLAAVHQIQLGEGSATCARDYRDYAVGALAAAIGDCDLFLSFERCSSPSTTKLLQVLKPKKSVGFVPGFDIEIPFNRAIHATDLAFSIPIEFATDLCIEDFATPPTLPDAALALIRKLRADLPRNSILLAVHADTKPEKTWAPANLAQVLNEFLELHRNVIAIVVGMAPFVIDIGRNRGRLLSCHGVPLPVALSIIAACDLFLGIDSCMLHMADLSRVPGVGLFGPTDPSEFGFRFARHLHVSAATMSEISVKEVAEALEALWSSVFP